MDERVAFGWRNAAKLIGVLLLVTGLTLALAMLVAGQQIGDKIWEWRGRPYELGIELLFWSIWGLVVSFVLCIVGTEMIFASKTSRPRPRAEPDEADQDRTDDNADQDGGRVEPQHQIE